MKYFMHDTNSFQDEKITELFIQYGYEGIGLFFTILEKLAMQEKPVKTVVLKKQLGVGKKLEKVWSFMESIHLISSNNGETFNENLLKFSEKYQIKKDKNKERIAQWRDKQTVEKDVTRNESVRNDDKSNLTKDNETNTGSSADAPEQPSEVEDEKPKRTRTVFSPPTLEEIFEYSKTGDITRFNAESFFDHFTSNGWKVGRAKAIMVDWKAALRGWQRRSGEYQPEHLQKETPSKFKKGTPD